LYIKSIGKIGSRHLRSIKRSSKYSPVRIHYRKKKKFILTTGQFVRIILFILLLSLALFELKYIFYKTDYFRIQKILVEGNRILSEEEIVKMSGLAPLMHVFEIKERKVAKRLSRNPFIKKVFIVQKGSVLKLKIIEREPVVIAKAYSGGMYLVDGEGVLLKKIESTEKANFPVISGLNLKEMKLGDRLNLKVFSLAKAWLDFLKGTFLHDISEFNVSDLNNLYFYTIDGIKIFVDTHENFLRRVTFLDKLLKKIKKEKRMVDYIDTRLMPGEKGLIVKYH